MNANLIYAVLLFLTAQSMIFFQANGQFFNEWFARNTVLLSVVGGSIISYIFITATKFSYIHFETVWPGRFLGFSVGIVSYAILTWIFMGEGINTKTAISLTLATSIILIQIFWK
jgi:hypothetical protein|tara:strand:- start:331 stop:675 length:345 start_codon:yes stop_codon:yes gene_type:complete